MTVRLATARLSLLTCGVAAVGILCVLAPALAVGVTVIVCLLVFGARLRDGWAILALGFLSVAAILVTEASQGDIASSWKLAGHVVLLPGIVFLLFRARELPFSLRRGAYLAVGLTATCAVIGLLGGLGSTSDAVGAIWQDARWIAAFGVGFAIADRLGRRTHRWVFTWLFALNAVNVLVSVYELRGPHAEQRFGIPSVAGVFGHPTQSTVAATVLLLFVLAERSTLSRREWFAAVAVAAIDIMLSARLKGLIGLGAGALVLGAVRAGVRPRPLALLCVVLPVAVMFALVQLTPPPQSYNANATTGLANIYGHSTPRVTLFESAERLANRSFPLGAGLATFGSYLDEPREHVTFTELGVVNKYGFRRNESYVSDNNLAHILGERGYLGLAAWLLSIAAVLWCALAAPCRFGMFPALAIAAAVAMSPVLPVFRDGTELILVFVPVGMVFWGVAAGRRRVLQAEPAFVGHGREAVGARSPVFSTAPVARAPAARSRVTRRRLGAFVRDYVLASGGVGLARLASLATLVILTRALSTDEFALYSLGWATWLLVSQMMSGLDLAYVNLQAREDQRTGLQSAYWSLKYGRRRSWCSRVCSSYRW